MYLEGSLSFCQGPVEMVEVATGLPADAASLVGSLFSELVQLGANEAWDSLPASITGWMTEPRLRPEQLGERPAGVEGRGQSVGQRGPPDDP